MFLSPKDGAGKLRFAITTAGYNNEKSISVSSSLTVGVWTHVAVVLTGSSGTLYVNGAVAATNNALSLTPSSLGTTSNNDLGKSAYIADPYFSGLIDEVKVLTRALSPSEISGAVTSTPTSYVYGAGRLYSVDQAGTVTYTLADALESDATLADVAGTVTGTYLYDAFGNERPFFRTPPQQFELQRRRIQRVAHLVGQPGRERASGGEALGAQRSPHHVALVRDVDAERVAQPLSVGRRLVSAVPANETMPAILLREPALTATCN